jgi:hypothetical protein
MIHIEDLQVGDLVHYNDRTPNREFHGIIGKVIKINTNRNLHISCKITSLDGGVTICNRPQISQLDHIILTPEVLFRL